MTSFEFVFILHLMKEITEVSCILCQHLQCKSQDILNAMHLVASTKSLIQKLRDEGWDSLFEKVKLFCAKHDIEVPIMSAPYVGRGGRARLQRDHITLEHHYRVDIFNGAIDCQLQELNTRFSDNMIELLTLSCALDPKDGCKSFNIDDICNLAKRYYPQDFTEFEREGLRIELRHYEFEISRHSDLQKLATIYELCQCFNCNY
ncbi:uncharacterized protein LOC109724423 [Ananas comosus]|uniref:Uncharacterized protein LOC109724423 n=1 Tax=Ananas comosus TaxID=4615 RepID=A0A6P5GTN5_ANACO|nr:uncharacterized protein LOC109724423 [Ananas comosus]